MLGDTLSSIIDALNEETITLNELMEQGGSEGMLVLCAFCTLPFLIPVSIPGVSTVFGAAIVLIAVALFLNRTPWLPKRIREKELDADKLIPVLEKGVGIVSRMERFLKPRVLLLTSPTMQKVNSLAILSGGVLLMAPFGLIPFSNTLPALAILFFASGMSQRDGLFVSLGYTAVVGTLAYFAFLMYMAWQGGAALLQ